ncbi:MAG: DUF4388 domain-containing protein, partial [Myxococcota bacterium]|nr:DUF4388 domain-containing protein [Myxococcota bacterium]
MSTPTLLLVDGDPHSRRLMEVSLRKAGYDLLTAPDAETVLALPPTTEIDLIISDTALPGLDGFELRRRLLDHPRWQNLPFVFLTREGQIEDRRRGLELGVEEYLTRPIFVREVVARVQILLQKQSLSASQPLPAVPLEGSLESLGLVDLLQTMQQGQATGLIYLDREEYRGRIYIRHGRVLDARVGRLDGEEAFFRLLRWPEGSFTVDLREVHQRQRITKGLDELLDEGLSLLDRCSALQLRLPVPDPVLRVDLPRLALDLDRIPLQVSDVLRLFDGVRTVSRVVEDSPFPDLETLRATVRLYEQHLLLLAEGEEHDDKRTLSEELNNWLTSVGDERPRGSKSTGAHPSARPRQASSERALRARAGRSRPPGEEPEGRTGTTQVWSLKSRESPRPQSALVEAAPDAPPLADDLEPEPPPDTEELPVFKKISHVAASTAPVVTVPERSEAGEAEGFLEIFTPLPASLSVDATSRPSPEVEVVGTLPPPVLDQGPLPPYVPLASLAEGPRQTEPAAGLPPEIPSRTWLEEQIQLRVAEELQRRVQQEYIQRRVEEEVRRRLLPEQGRGPTAAREPRAVVAGSAHQQLAEGIRGQVEAEERQRLAGQVREQIAAQTRDQQDAFARSLRDQAAALRDPAGDASTPPEPEQERRQRLLEAKEKALEESRRRSELILQQALAEARQAEEERLAAVVEVRLATEEANLAQEVRSEIEQTERRAREEAESLREQARLARQEAEEA